MPCDNDLVEKHTDMLHGMDMRIAKLVTLQEITTSNIGMLTKDIKETMCKKNDCTLAFNKIRELEEKTKHTHEKLVRIEHLEGKMTDLWFFVFAGRNPKLTALMVLGSIVLLSSEIKQFLGGIIE